jgi:hypothetical protein
MTSCSTKRPTNRDPLCSRNLRSAVRIVFALALLFAGTASAAFAATGYSVAAGTLLTIDLESGDTEVIGATGAIEGRVWALTFGPDGQLHAAAALPPEGVGSSDYGLFTVDPTTGAATLVGSFGLLLTPPDVPTGLTFDADGDLWLTVGAELYLVDTTTANATLAHTLPREVRALATLGDQLYALTSDSQVEELDPATGSLTPLFPVSFAGSILDASFDAAGGLRFLTVDGGILTAVPLFFYRVDLGTGEVVETFSEEYPFMALEAEMSNLAVRGPQGSVIAVPTLSTVGLALLASLLGAVGFRVLRRRR